MNRSIRQAKLANAISSLTGLDIAIVTKELDTLSDGKFNTLYLSILTYEPSTEDNKKTTPGKDNRNYELESQLIGSIISTFKSENISDTDTQIVINNLRKLLEDGTLIVSSNDSITNS
jgi:hypothetical protein